MDTYDRRFTSKLDVQWAAGQLKVSLTLDEQEAGYIVFDGGPLKSRRLKGECLQWVNSLRSAGKVADQYWTVVSVEVSPPYLQKGHGIALYEAGFKALQQRFNAVYVGPNTCLRVGDTSEEAWRVWDSLKRRYPHEKAVLFVG